jgi:hypothetical protein
MAFDKDTYVEYTYKEREELKRYQSTNSSLIQKKFDKIDFQKINNHLNALYYDRTERPNRSFKNKDYKDNKNKQGNNVRKERREFKEGREKQEGELKPFPKKFEKI